MKNFKIPSSVRYLILILVVAMLGALAGWYVFVQRQIKTTSIEDTARGFGQETALGSTVGSSFANESTPQSFTVGTSSAIATGETGSPAPRLWHVTANPIAGFGFYSSSTTAYFAERATGNILSASPAVQGITRLTNTLLPKIYEALLRADGSVILRSLSDDGTITSFAGTIGTSTPGTPAALRGVYLPQNIVALGVRVGSPAIFALIANPHGGVVGVTTDSDGQKQKQVMVSALSGWRAYVLADGTIDIAQKASDGITGYAFELSGNTLTPLLVGLPGLVIAPRASSSALIYSTSQSGTLSLFAKTAASSTPVKLPIQTIADKCAWAPGSALIAYCAVPQTRPSGSYERSWYSGEVHTADTWWKVDASAGTATEIYAPDSGTTFDAINPAVDVSGEYIAFMDSNDNSLWMLRITP